MKQLVKTKFKEIKNLQTCDLLVFMEPLTIFKEQTKAIKSDLQGFQKDLIASSTCSSPYVSSDTFFSVLWKFFGRGSEVCGLNKKLFNAIRGSGLHHDQASIAKLQAFIDVFDHYHILKRGEKEDSRDLYKIMSAQPPRKTLETPPVTSEYTIAFSKIPHGITQGRIKEIPMIDPAVAGRNSNVNVWLKHFW
jgi:hypothetical protein